jgi:hypothetical protein
MNTEQLRAQIQIANDILNNIMTTNFAKESLLKDDEKTQKQITDRISKEIDEHINLHKEFLQKQNKEELINNGVITFSEAQVFDRINDFDKIKSDLINNSSQSTFNNINLIDYKENVTLNFQINEKLTESTFVCAISIEDKVSGKRKMIGEYRGSTPLTSPINLMIAAKGSYNISVITNKGEITNLTWG